MNKKLVLALMLLISLPGCATYENTRKPENMTSLHIDKDYLEAYRAINETMLNDCHTIPSALRSTVFPDNESATIIVGEAGIITYSLDLKKSPAGGADMQFYSYYKGMVRIALKMQNNLNRGIKGCYW